MPPEMAAATKQDSFPKSIPITDIFSFLITSALYKSTESTPMNEQEENEIEKIVSCFPERLAIVWFLFMSTVTHSSPEQEEGK